MIRPLSALVTYFGTLMSLQLKIEVRQVEFRLLSKDTAHKGHSQPHQYAAKAIFILALPQRRLRVERNQPFSYDAPHSESNELALVVHDAFGRDPFEVFWFPPRESELLIVLARTCGEVPRIERTPTTEEEAGFGFATVAAPVSKFS